MSSISKPRKLNYTGCWTCKARKVRCDERRSTCGNCSRRGIVCGGYEIKLQWMGDSSSHRGIPTTSINHGRCSIKLDQSAGRRYRMEEIETFISTIDNDALDRLSSSKGPFSLFPVHVEHHGQEDVLYTPQFDRSGLPDNTSKRQREAQNEIESTTSLASDGMDKSPEPELDLPLAPNSSINTYWTDSVTPEVLPVEEPDNHLDPLVEWQLSSSKSGLEIDQYDDITFAVGGIGDTDEIETPDMVWHNIVVNNTELDASCEDGAANNSATTPQSVLQTSRATSTGHQYFVQKVPSSLFQTTEVDELMHHYISYVADVLQPIQHPQNPYHGLYIPSALEGALIYVSDSKPAETNIQLAVYHATIASAAFHRWNCNKVHDKYRELGEQHKWHALHVLQAAVNSSTSKPDYRNLLLAMLSLLTVGIISGEDDDFVIHLSGTIQLRKLRKRWKLVSGPTQQLNDISSFLTLLARTLSFRATSPWVGHIEQNPHKKGVATNMVDTRSSYGYMYGITPKIAEALEETCRLAEMVHRCNGNQENKHLPDHLLEACEALGDSLLSWSFESERSASLLTGDETMLSIFEHHANAWYYATLIYYYRRIQGYESVDVVNEVQCVMEHMNAIEAIKAKSKAHSTTALAPITWPVFIASCESMSSTRAVCEEWWERVQQYGIANIRKQWEIVRKVWAKQDEMQQKGFGVMNWMDFFSELKINLLPV